MREAIQNKTIIYDSALVNSGDVIDYDNRDFQVEVTLSPDNKFVTARIVCDISDMYEGNNAFRAEVEELIKELK